jgi:2-keto-4-pentenoate hydratase/2-oxohepta-3-ene-1,7-dioic acid hydratase in catechol pathway
MQLIHFRERKDTGKAFRLGVKTPEGILDVGGSGNVYPATIDALLHADESTLQIFRSISKVMGKLQTTFTIIAEKDIEYGPCVLQPEKIICVGLNYRQHAAESGMQVPQTPVLFSKFNNAIAACGEEIPLPDNAVQYDYEAEIVAVIGKKARFVGENEALDYVFGYCNGNDLSARDLQTRTTQWLLGKTPDKFMPTGPYLVTADEIGDPQGKTIRCWLNGELRQNSNTSDMVFSVAQLVSYLSQYMTLQPGDLISTGTPQGVILGMKEKNWLKPGDEVVVEVEGLGKLFNKMMINK